MDPGKRKVERSVFCFLPADFLVSRALGGNAFNQVRRFFLFTKGISRGWKWKILFCFSAECLSRLLLLHLYSKYGNFRTKGITGFDQWALKNILMEHIFFEDIFFPQSSYSWGLSLPGNNVIILHNGNTNTRSSLRGAHWAAVHTEIKASDRHRARSETQTNWKRWAPRKLQEDTPPPLRRLNQYAPAECQVTSDVSKRAVLFTNTLGEHKNTRACQTDAWAREESEKWKRKF